MKAPHAGLFPTISKNSTKRGVNSENLKLKKCNDLPCELLQGGGEAHSQSGVNNVSWGIVLLVSIFFG